MYFLKFDSVRNPVWYLKQAEPVWESERLSASRRTQDWNPVSDACASLGVKRTSSNKISLQQAPLALALGRFERQSLFRQMDSNSLYFQALSAQPMLLREERHPLLW